MDYIVDYQWLDFAPVLVSRLPACVVALIVAGLSYAWGAGRVLPFFWGLAGGIMGLAARKLNRPHRSAGELFFRGAIVTFIALLMALILAEALKMALAALPLPGVVSGLFLAALMAVGGPWRLLARLQAGLGAKAGLPAAIDAGSRDLALATSVSTAEMDIYARTRLAMALAVRLFDKAAVAPVFWYLLGGWPAALAQAMLAAMVWSYGRAPGAGAFEALARRLDFAFGVVPSFLAAALLSIAAVIVPGAGIGRVMLFWAGGWSRTGGAAPYAQGGLPLSVTAWMLGLALGGPVRTLDGAGVPAPWIGPAQASAKVEPFHLKRMIYLSLCAHLLWLLVLLSLYVVMAGHS